MNFPSTLVYFRLLEEKDFSSFIKIREEAFRNEPEAFGSDYIAFSSSSHLSKEHFFNQVLNYPFSFVLGAFTTEDNKLVGIAGCTCHSSIKRRHKGILWGMYVNPLHRNQGIARHLTSLVLQTAKNDTRCEQLLITVSPPGSLAHNFYEKVGFIPYGVEYQALKINSEYVDEILMMKIL